MSSAVQTEASVEESLDPADWEALATLGHRMVDDMLDYLRTVRERPPWQSAPAATRARFKRPLPLAPQDPSRLYEEFKAHVLPYPSGNIHPRFWGFVMGTGTALSALSEMLAATMNPGASGFDDSATLVEGQVIAWLRELLGFPAGASGLLVSGASMANFIGLAVARGARAGFDVRARGLSAAPQPLTLYASREAHSSIRKGVEMLGLGRDALRLLPVDGDYRLDLGALREAVAADRAAGRRPICVVGNAGTVNTGATDDLAALADFAREEGLWFHVDGAFGALAALHPELRPQVAGLERADSLAFDLHKWGYLPYEAGCVLVRDEAAHREAFAVTAAYLTPAAGGLAPAGPQLSDYGPQLSRGFRALKIWMALQEHGTEKLGRLVRQNVEQAAYLARLVRAEPELELGAPVPLNIVCFRYRGTPDGFASGATSVSGGSGGPLLDSGALDALNAAIVLRLHEDGIAVPTYTRLGGRYLIRAAITNHRSRRADFELLVREVLRLGRELSAGERFAAAPRGEN